MASMSETSSTSPVANLVSPKTSKSTPATGSQPSPEAVTKPEFWWMVKPCAIYKDEYKDCKSLRARFHQYFVEGKASDCQHWKEAYDHCILWDEKNDIDGLRHVIESEKKRVRKRLRDHYANDVWEHRQSPPENWNSELPESIRKGYENSYLKTKADELKSGEEKLGNFAGNYNYDGEGGRVRESSKSSCSIV